MRNDLELACAPCGLRLPETEARCPACGRELISAQEALAELRSAASEHVEIDPLRALILYLPAAAGILVAIGSALVISFENITPQNALNMGFLLVSLVALFAGSMLALAIPWFLWAGLVKLAFFLLRRRAPSAPGPLLLVPLPLPSLLTPNTPLSLPRLRLGPRALVAGLTILFAALLVADIFADKPSIDHSSLSAFVKTASLSLIPPLVGLAVASVPLGLAFTAIVHTWEQLRDAIRVLHGREKKRAAWGGMPDLAELWPKSAKSARALGRARLGENTPIIAPLSGAPCIAFRLVGRIGELAIDDGDATGFLLETDERTIEIRGQRFAVALPVPTRRRREIDPAERGRLARLLAEHGLEPVFEEVELGEACVLEGDRIEVGGELASEATPGQGYRGAPHRQVIHDSESEPILITAARHTT